MTGDSTDTLPALIEATDLAQAKQDLADHGFCLIKDLLPADRVNALRGRIMELAEREIADGTDYVYENGANQRVWSLLRKGEMFAELACDPTVMTLMEHLLGFNFLLSNLDVNIAG